MYPQPVQGAFTAFGLDCDYTVLQKIYGADQKNEKRYSSAKCTGCEMKVIAGNPDPAHFSTSYVERQNLMMRMGCGASLG